MTDADTVPEWRVMDVRCTECDTNVHCTGGREPPAPDRHGMMHTPFKCPDCGESGTLTQPAPGPHYGPTDVTGGDGRFELPDDA